MIQRRVQIHVRLSGALQGTGFRTTLQRQALAWGLVGWVRDLDDGGAELVVQGPERMAESLVGWCRRGPLGGAVTEVVATRQGLEAFQGFDVRR